MQSAAIINQFIEEVTKGTIKDVVTSDDLIMAQMVLVNAVYFKGTWQTQFKPTDTRDLPFTPLDPSSGSIQVPMMFAERRMKYGKCCVPISIFLLPDNQGNVYFFSAFLLILSEIQIEMHKLLAGV